MIKETLLLVDGHNLLFKAFYGLPTRLNLSNEPIHGIIGFLGMFKKIVGIVNPDYILVVFDSESSISRKIDYDQYKKNRKDFNKVPDKENPFTQLVGIKQSLEKMLIPYIEEDGLEADDVIASYALNSKSHVIIASTDSDFFQLIDKNVKILRYNGENTVIIGESELKEKFNIRPNQYVEFKSLVGDMSDNISGVSGIGPKKAVQVLNGNLRLSLQELEIVFRNKQLIQLRPSLLDVKKNNLSAYNKNLSSIKIGQLLKDLSIL
ncbi:MAG: flap endonuclease [Candidatus Parcubacteria bacterium]|nr:flap endonuclease [Candidatus Parcubacteria bacterium]